MGGLAARMIPCRNPRKMSNAGSNLREEPESRRTLTPFFTRGVALGE
jgi:hypothetical protein